MSAVPPRQLAYKHIADAARLSVGAGRCDDPHEIILRLVLWVEAGCEGSLDDALGIAEEKPLSPEDKRRRNRLMKELYTRLRSNVHRAHQRYINHRIGRAAAPGSIEELCERIHALSPKIVGERQFRRIVRER